LVDEEVVRARLARLEEALRYLAVLAEASEGEFLGSWQHRGLAERVLGVAAQVGRDLGNHGIAAAGLRAPDSYADTFRILAEAGLLQGDLAGPLVRRAGLRNLLVHQYTRIDHALLYRYLHDLSAVRGFARAVSGVLRS